MHRQVRPFAFALVMAGALVWSPSAQEAHRATGAAAKTVSRAGRDLGMATPESVGISAERLRRLDAALARLVEDKQVAGLVTLVERHGKIAHFDTAGRLDVRKPDAMQKHQSLGTTRPIDGLSRSIVYQAIVD